MKNRCPVCLGLLIKDIPDEKGRCHACQCVKAADAAGMTYGKWMAKYRPPLPVAKPEAEE